MVTTFLLSAEYARKVTPKHIMEWKYKIHLVISAVTVTMTKYEGLPKISENLLVITWILTLSPNFHRHLRSIYIGLVYNDPSDFAIFGSTNWSLPALACLVPVAILLGSLQWIRNAGLSTAVCFLPSRITSRSFAIISGVVHVDGRPECLRSSTDSRPSLKRLNHSNVLAWLKACSPKTSFSTGRA